MKLKTIIALVLFIVIPVLILIAPGEWDGFSTLMGYIVGMAAAWAAMALIDANKRF